MAKEIKKIELRRDISFFTDVVYLHNQIILCGNFEIDNENEDDSNQVAFIDFD
jgi:hypothetical protein